MTASSLATIHNELYQPPEEYAEELGKDRKQPDEISLVSSSLLDSLPDGGSLPPFSLLPILTWDGTVTSSQELDDATADYATEFRRAIGGCEALLPSDLMPHQSTKDLFCSKED
jgi:hypothetical protein